MSEGQIEFRDRLQATAVGEKTLRVIIRKLTRLWLFGGYKSRCGKTTPLVIIGGSVQFRAAQYETGLSDRPVSYLEAGKANAEFRIRETGIRTSQELPNRFRRITMTKAWGRMTHSV